jgi:hypothetical protein
VSDNEINNQNPMTKKNTIEYQQAFRSGFQAGGFNRNLVDAKFPLFKKSFSINRWINKVDRWREHAEFMAGRAPIESPLLTEWHPYGQIPKPLKVLLRTKPEGLTWPIAVDNTGATVKWDNGFVKFHRSLFLCEKGIQAEQADGGPSFEVTEDQAKNWDSFDLEITTEGVKIVPVKTPDTSTLKLIVVKHRVLGSPTEGQLTKSPLALEIERRIATGMQPEIILEKHSNWTPRNPKLKYTVRLRLALLDPKVIKAKKDIKVILQILTRLQDRDKTEQTLGFAAGKAAAAQAKINCQTNNPVIAL